MTPAEASLPPPLSLQDDAARWRPHLVLPGCTVRPLDARDLWDVDLDIELEVERELARSPAGVRSLTPYFNHLNMR